MICGVLSLPLSDLFSIYLLPFDLYKDYICEVLYLYIKCGMKLDLVASRVRHDVGLSSILEGDPIGSN